MISGEGNPGRGNLDSPAKMIEPEIMPALGPGNYRRRRAEYDFWNVRLTLDHSMLETIKTMAWDSVTE